MRFVEILLSLLVFAVLIIGFVALVKPLPRLHIPNRKAAGLLIVGGFGLAVIMGALHHAPDAQVVGQASRTSVQEEAAVASAPQSRANQSQLGDDAWQRRTIADLYVLIGRANSCAQTAHQMVTTPGIRRVNPDCDFAQNNAYRAIVEHNDLPFPKLAQFGSHIAAIGKAGGEISTVILAGVERAQDGIIRGGDIVGGSVMYAAAAQHEAVMWSEMRGAESLRVAALRELGESEINADMTFFSKRELDEQE